MAIWAITWIIRLCGAATTAASPTWSSNCRCLAGQDCFPTTDQWAAFNKTVEGRLILPRPTASPCYVSTFDAAKCTAVKANFTKGAFRSTVPGSMQAWNWEENGEARCPLETSDTNPGQCQQGNVPPYGVTAESINDVRRAALFASKHNLRLVVKNTGHDFLGRSTAPDSFLLWMHKMNSMVVNMTYVPTGCDGQLSAKPAVTVSGGPQWGEVYAKVSRETNDQYVVIGGMCPSVGAAGGYFQGEKEPCLLVLPTFPSREIAQANALIPTHISTVKRPSVQV